MGRDRTEALTMPAAVNGFIPTLNQQGYMLAELDAYTKAFIEFCAICRRPVVDVGAAYGLTTLPALETGAFVVAVDADKRHLDILHGRVPLESIANLTTHCTTFPDNMPLHEHSVAAFLLARVAHFFTPPQLEDAVKKMYGWLVEGGKVFLTAETPYLKNWQAFHPVYEQRRAMGEPWPGFVPDVTRYVTQHGQQLPQSMLLLDTQTLERVFLAAGFTIEKLDYLARPGFPDDMRFDGRESVGMIAKK